jgi:ABC-type branched-subunit amino acid transport system substrate-binding protein
MDQLRQPAVGVDVTKIKGTAPVSPFGPKEDAFVTQYKAAFFNQTPVQYADYTYDCVYVLALAAQKAGSVNGTAIRNTIRNISAPGGTVIQPGQWSTALSEVAAGHNVNWEGAAGSENFDANGDVKGSYEVWGVNTTYQIYRIAFIPESIITAASLTASAYTGVQPAVQQPDSFAMRVQAVAYARWS